MSIVSNFFRISELRDQLCHGVLEEGTFLPGFRGCADEGKMRLEGKMKH